MERDSSCAYETIGGCTPPVETQDTGSYMERERQKQRDQMEY